MGREDGFDACYREHFAFVWRLVGAFGVEPGARDDLVQETFLVVRRRLGSFQPDRPMRAWIAGIARRVVSHHRRARDRAARREAGWSYTASDDPEATLERADAVALIESFLDELDHDKREVFVLMEIEELSAREVATIVGVGAPTVYSRLREARRRFASFVERERAARWSAS